jgi:hypothetical protein
MSKVRAVVRNLNSYSDPIIANSMAMWAAVSALGTHEKFHGHQFQDHPHIFPKLNSYFIQKCLRKADLLAVSEEVLRVKGIATCVETDIKALRREHGASARRSRWSSSSMAERQGGKKIKNRRKMADSNAASGGCNDK